jgi:GWxTD domain-containing protein
MRKRSIYIVLQIAVLVIFTGSCTPVKTVSVDPNDMSYLYNPIRNSLHPRYRIFNDNDQTSTLSIKMNSSELFFNEANPEGVPRAQMSVFYRLFNLSQGRVTVDTAMYNLPINKLEGRRDYIYNFSVNAESGYKYEIELLLKDIVRNITIQAHLTFDKSSEVNMHDFKVRGHFNKLDIFTQVLREGDYINILYPKSPIDSLYISFFKPDDEIPDAPFMLTPDKSINIIPDQRIAVSYSDTLPIMLPAKGIYLISPDSIGLYGLSLLNFGKTYPGLSDPETMISSLIYLSNRTKINEMMEADNLKIELDNFWLKITNNVERSRELLRIYYNRVLYANYFFGSHKQGWQTDRGMIYTIYGPPDKVYRTPDGERWGYNKPVVKSGWGIRYKVKEEFLFFNFMKRENPFSDNDYSLIRKESVTTYWDQAIRSWLSGIVFRLDNPTDI